jgi:acetylornithine deacetylase/succinyl-diaminopimelate desuccinylase-like protein
VTERGSNLGPIFANIDAHFEESVAEIQHYLRQPGISTTGEGMRESAELSRELMEKCGAVETELVETSGNPVVFGRLYANRPDAKTLIVSSLYDLVPVDPDEWISPPFAADIVDSARAQEVGIPPEAGDVIVARGAANQRGPSLAFMLTLKAIKDATGYLPVNVIFSLDGEEEIASPNWREFLRAKEEILKQADGAYQHGFRQDETGRHLIHCGFKGVSLFELVVRGGSWGGTLDGRDLWAADIVWVHSPIQKLLEAVDAVLDENGRCRVEGFWDGIVQPTPEEAALYERLRAEFDEEAAKKVRNVAHFRSHKDPSELFIDLVSGPILNIDGIVAGYTEAFTTVMPMTATAKFDVRIVPDQSMSRFFEKLRAHLDNHGLDMVEIHRTGGTEPGKTSPSDPLIKTAEWASDHHGVPAQIWPISAAANPLGMYARPPFNVPILFAGLGRSGNYHVPNEWCSVEGIRESMKWSATFIHAWAEASGS